MAIPSRARWLRCVDWASSVTCMTISKRWRSYRRPEPPEPPLLDQVAFRRLDLHPARLEEVDPSVQLVRLARHLQQHPPVVPGHVRPPDVGHDLELPPELVDHRLLHERGAEDQLEPPSRHRRESNARCRWR